jgi:hypothetical protein
MSTPEQSDDFRQYIYAWGNNEQRKRFQGRACRIVGRGAMNSRMIEFLDDGEKAVVSGNALRRDRTPRL